MLIQCNAIQYNTSYIVMKKEIDTEVVLGTIFNLLKVVYPKWKVSMQKLDALVWLCYIKK